MGAFQRRPRSVGAACLAAAAWALATIPGAGAPSPAGAGAQTAAETFIAALRRDSGAPGLQAAVAERGRIVFSASIGDADLEHRQPVSRDTRFRIGSVSKLLTAAAALRLADQRRLDLAAPIQQYVPSFPSKDHLITVRDLLGHLAGIRHYQGSEFLNRNHSNSVTEALERFAASPLLFPPRTKASYSSYGFTLLSAAIETASGRPFLDAVQDLVVSPLGLQQTVPDRSEVIVADRARGYERGSSGQLTNAPWIDLSDRWAAGGFLSTAEDLVRFGSAFLATDLEPGRTPFLLADTIQAMFAPQRTLTGDPTLYGLAWRLKLEGNVVLYAHHGGDSMGARAFLYLEPGRALVVALLSNLGGAPLGEKEASALANLVGSAGSGREPSASSTAPYVRNTSAGR